MAQANHKIERSESLTKYEVDLFQRQPDQTPSLSGEPLSVFQTVKPFHCHLIDNDTPITVLTCLIHLAEKAPLFSLDLVTLHRFGKPDSIYRMNIEIVQSASSQSIILIFRTSTFNKLTFQPWMHIKLLLEKIFRPSAYVQTWNSNQRDLLPLITCHLLTEDHLKQIRIIDLEKRFQGYFRRTFPDEFFPSIWPLELAISTTFNECISLNQAEYEQIKQNSVNTLTFDPSAYRILDCLAMTKLSTAIFLEWDAEQLLQYRKYHEK